MKSVALVHGTRSNDARFIHRLCEHAYFIEIQNITGMKNIGVIGKNLASRVRKVSLAKEVAFLTNCRFFILFLQISLLMKII